MARALSRDTSPSSKRLPQVAPPTNKIHSLSSGVLVWCRLSGIGASLARVIRQDRQSKE